MLTAVLGNPPPPELPGFLNALAGPIAHYGVWVILLLVFIEDFGVPVPGETALIAGAVVAGSGRLSVVAVGVTGFVAAVLGDNVGYAIGRYGGRRLVERWGPRVFMTPARLKRTEDFFNRHGGNIVIVARFLEGLRQANGIICGLSRMHWPRFLVYNVLGAALWVGVWVSAGYLAGHHITGIYDAITRYFLYVALAVVAAIVAGVLLHRRRERRSRPDAVSPRDPDQQSKSQ